MLIPLFDSIAVASRLRSAAGEFDQRRSEEKDGSKLRKSQAASRPIEIGMAGQCKIVPDTTAESFNFQHLQSDPICTLGPHVSE